MTSHNTIEPQEVEIKVASTISWDDIDTFYLANAFTIEQLEHEISSTKCKFPFEDWHTDYIACCREAIRWIRRSIPKPTIKANSKFVDIDTLKSSVDIVSIAERYSSLKKSGNYFKGNCPLHRERTPSFFVYPERQTWHCFGACNTGGDVISLVMKVENTDFKGAVAILGGVR
jgi:hypothetical protein